jgi:4-hydroxy-3-polyprenylbenzoate decarboxylase
MPYSDLQSFLSALDERGYLQRIAVSVDPALEIAEIADRVSKLPAADQAEPPVTDPVHGSRGGHALLFEQVSGSDIPVAINVFGSYARVRMALDCECLEALAARVQQLVKPEMPTTLIDKLKKIPELARLASYPPKVVKSGMCHEVVRTTDADLMTLPFLQCWPRDGEPGYAARPPEETAGTARYMTFAGVYSKHPETGERNVGMYRAQVYDSKTMAMHWHMHHDGARHYRAYAAAGRRMPLALVFGGDAVLPYAATCPLPPEISELLFAGFLNGSGIHLVPARTVPLEVPANAEIVIEGWVDPKDTLWEGPFGDHTGFYSLADRYPKFTVSAITSRRQPIFPATIVGPPPQEDYYLGKATERIFLPLLQMIVPDILDYHLPMFGAFHNCVFVRIRKEYPYQARRVMHSIWGAGQMAFTKFIVVVDEDVNVHDEQAVWFRLCANVDPSRDLEAVTGPLDILDHASVVHGAGGKLGIDATRKWPQEGQVREFPDPLVMSDEIKARVDRRWREYGFPG